MHAADAHLAHAMTFEAEILRPERSLLAMLVGIGLVIIALQIGVTHPFSIASYIGIGAVFLRHMYSRGQMWNEAVTFGIGAEGIALRRANGLQQLAPWRYFEEARIELRARRHEHRQVDRWRLTLVNKFKPAIGSFLHTRDAEKTVFFFPLVIELEATRDQVDQLRRIAETYIDLAQIPVHRPDKSPPVDLASLFHVQSCQQCDYPLRGLSRSGRCPECGWAFDESMFVLDAEWISRRTSPLAISVFSVLSACWILLRQGWTAAIFIMVGIAVAYALFRWWQSGEAGREFNWRVLVTDQGIELWRGGHKVVQYPWANICELHAARGDVGRLRVGMWLDRKYRVRFSRFFDRWVSSPPSPPVVDVLLNGSNQQAQMVFEELQRRRTIA